MVQRRFEQPTVEPKVIQQLEVNNLTNSHSVSNIENALISLYLRRNDLAPKLDFIEKLDEQSSSNVIDDVSNHISDNDFSLDLMTMEKYFESLLEDDLQEKNGSYFTPYYIVDFIVKNTVPETSDAKVIDLCCGSGAFLVGAARYLNRKTDKTLSKILQENIYGIDISSKAVRKTRIILNLYALSKGVSDDLELNLQNGDSLKINPERRFPEVFEDGGFDSVLGNPPYTRLSDEDELGSISGRFNTVPESRNSTNLFLPFLELMLEYSKKNNSRSGYVIPLSLSYHSGLPYKNARELIASTQDDFYLSFYDRSPDSLFGDKIKTRNSILFLDRNNGASNKIYSTKLKRWNSRDRDSLFRNLSYSRVDGLSIKEKGIPKVSRKTEVEVLKEINSNTSIEHYLSSNENCETNKIYFYSTAYNWLPIFRELPKSYDHKGDKYIPSSINTLKCGSSREQKITHSILSSMMAYWYWMIYSDGFHLNKGFVNRFPINPQSFSEKSRNQLIKLSDSINNKSQENYFRSNNSGYKLGNYNKLECLDLISNVDKILVEELSLPDEFYNILIKRLWSHISAGRKEFKNNQVLIEFVKGELDGEV